MNSKIKAALSISFILIVGFFVARSFLPVRHISRPRQPQAPPLRKAVAKMAIILDDWGKNYALFEDVKSLKRPVTLAILPHLKYSERIAREAHSAGMGVMLHMPMEPSVQAPLEPYTITRALSEKNILLYLEEAIESIPHLSGVNNHMGSAATSDERVMKIVLRRLKEKKLFFIDSNVVTTSRGWRIARQIGLPYSKRDVFIDNEMVLDRIKNQLAQAQKIALTRGQAVVIGHDKKMTLQAIREMIPVLEKSGIRLVLARELLLKGNA